MLVEHVWTDPAVFMDILVMAKKIIQLINNFVRLSVYYTVSFQTGREIILLIFFTSPIDNIPCDLDKMILLLTSYDIVAFYIISFKLHFWWLWHIVLIYAV